MSKTCRTAQFCWKRKESRQASQNWLNGAKKALGWQKWGSVEVVEGPILGYNNFEIKS